MGSQAAAADTSGHVVRDFVRDVVSGAGRAG
jgi:hypothetical protein